MTTAPPSGPHDTAAAQRDSVPSVRGRRVVLGVGGGIAAYKVASLLRLFTESGADVTVVPTEAALRFVGAPTWEALSGKRVSTRVWEHVEDVPHVRLGHEAELVVVAPATADLLARAAHGLADDLLTNVLLTARCPVVLAPAMHTEMWEHPATRANVEILRGRGAHVLEPAAGRLTGADTGKGRLDDPEHIFRDALRILDADRGETPSEESSPADSVLRGRRIVITAGGTREAIDPVRYLGNRSSGKQGYALATEAVARGAHVTLVTTSSLPVPAGVRTVTVESAREMEAAVDDLAPQSDVVIMSAAVADFRPREFQGHKIKKRQAAPGEPEPDDAPVIELVRNPDILAGLVRTRAARRAAQGDALAGPVIVGFAAETGDADGDVLFHARAKLARKGCDLLVANEVGVGLTFGQDDTTVHVLGPGGDVLTSVGPASKAVAASAVLDAVEGVVRHLP